MLHATAWAGYGASLNRAQQQWRPTRLKTRSRIRRSGCLLVRTPLKLLIRRRVSGRRLRRFLITAQLSLRMRVDPRWNSSGVGQALLALAAGPAKPRLRGHAWEGPSRQEDAGWITLDGLSLHGYRIASVLEGKDQGRAQVNLVERLKEIHVCRYRTDPDDLHADRTSRSPSDHHSHQSGSPCGSPSGNSYRISENMSTSPLRKNRSSIGMWKLRHRTELRCKKDKFNEGTCLSRTEKSFGRYCS